MTLIPTVRCRALREALAFYTGVLDFDVVGIWRGEDGPAYGVLRRCGRELHLSSHGGDGCYGQAIAVLVDDVDALFARFAPAGRTGRSSRTRRFTRGRPIRHGARANSMPTIRAAIR